MATKGSPKDFMFLDNGYQASGYAIDHYILTHRDTGKQKDQGYSPLGSLPPSGSATGSKN